MDHPWIASRPLALAGTAAVAGVLGSASPLLGVGAGAAAAVALGALLHQPRTAVLLLAALLAGLAAGRVAEERTSRVLETMAKGRWARAPPGAIHCRLDVTRCGEDPVRARAWLEGCGRDGVGVLCVWPGRTPDLLGPGAVVSASGRPYVPRPPGNPGEGDARRLLAERGVAFVIDVKTTENLVLVRSAPQFRPATWFFRVRRAAARRLASALPEDMAPLATALLLGLRAGIAPEERIRFERTGTMHVLAISGMHVLLLAGAVHALLRSFGVTARTAAGFTLLLALLYVPVAGGAPPIRRAVTVLTFYGLALVRGRPPDAASALGGAALLLALWRPEDVSRLGFRLSFAAAAGIFWLAPAWNERWGRRHRLLRRFPAVREDRPFRLRFEAFLLQALPVSLAAWLATQGLVAAALGVLTPLAPLTNLLVAPLLTLLLPAIVVIALGVESAVAPAALLIDALRALLDAASAIPGGFVVVSPWPAAAVACWCAGVFSLRHNAARGAVLLSLALLAAGAASRPTRPSLVLLDVGDGQAALVRLDNGNAVLVDGGSRGRPRLWRKVLRSALREEGVSRLEAVVCTHADADHWNALPELLATLPVGRLIVGGKVPPQLRSAAAAYGVPLVAPPAGSAIAAGEWSSLRLLAGDREAAGSDNDRALVLVLEAGAHRVLLPADREEAGLRRLLAIDPGRCDVLVAPHHGARCEVAPEFGAHVLPRYLLVSAGPNFSHGATLQAYGAERILKTWRNGALSVRFPTPRTMVVAAFRD